MGRLLNFLYWKFLGQMTVAGTFNGKTVIITLNRGRVENFFVWPDGSIENVTFTLWHMSPEDFKLTVGVYENQ